ncbi:MAG: hypothetical protein ABIZ49_06235, partial [Opitutaceae bacterium]
EVIARFVKLWSHRVGVLKHNAGGAAGARVVAAQEPVHADEPHPARRGRRGTAWAFAAALGLAIAAGLVWRSERGALPSAAAASPADPLIARAYSIFKNVNYNRANLAAAEDLARRASELAPESSAAWAARAFISSSYLLRGWDSSDRRRQEIESFANKALTFEPKSVEALLALAVMHNSQRAFGQAEAVARRALAVRDDDPRVYRALATAIGGQGRREEALALRRENARRFPRDPITLYDLAIHLNALGDWDAALETIDTALAVQPFGSGQILKARLLAAARGDLAGARAAMDALAPEDRTEIRAVGVAMWLGLLERRLDRVRAAAALTSETYLIDNAVVADGPKALSLALAFHLAGQPALARQQWQAAEAVARKELRDEAGLAARGGEQTVRAYLAIALVWQGREAEAAREIGPLEAALGEQSQPGLGDLALVARYHASLGNAAKAIPPLRAALNRRSFDSDRTLPLNPWWDKIRDQPEFVALLAEAKARVEQPTAGAQKTVATVPEKSIAVLAFDNLSDDKANEYFSDGISEELLNVLGRVEGLRVIARTSSFSFKGRAVPATEIGRALNASHLVEGSVQRVASKARVIARLLRADTGAQVWSQRFDQDLSDIFAAQDAVAGAIATALSLRLTEVRSGMGPRRVDPAAYELYARGRQAWNQRTPEAMVRADKYFDEAIARDPSFARAHVGLADVWLQGGQAGRLGSEAEALAMVRKALELEPNLAEAHASLGSIYATSLMEPRYAEAEREFATALKLNPSYASAHQWHARYLEGEARMGEALAAHSRAVQLDPLSTRIADNHGRALLLAGRFEEALSEFERALRLESGNVQARSWRTWMLSQSGRRDQAVEEARQLAGIDEKLARIFASDVFYRQGLRAEADRVFALCDPRDSTWPHYLLPIVSRGDDPLPVLGTRAMRRDNAVLLFLLPSFDRLHSNPDFRAWVQQAGMQEIFERAQAWRAAHPARAAEAKK